MERNKNKTDLNRNRKNMRMSLSFYNPKSLITPFAV